MAQVWALFLETTVTDASLLLARNGEAVRFEDFRSERSQECDLFEPVEALLAELPQGERLSEIVVGTGPGSYNGARVGIAAAQAISQVHRCKVAGLCSFEGVREAQENELVWAVGDARRESFFVLPIRGGTVSEVPQLLSEGEFLGEVKKKSAPMVTFESLDRLPRKIDCTQSVATTGGLLQAWTRRTQAERLALMETEVEAFYLRPPHITKAKGKVKP